MTGKQLSEADNTFTTRIPDEINKDTVIKKVIENIAKDYTVVLSCDIEISPSAYEDAVEYDLTIAGTQVTSANAVDILGDGTVSYDNDTKTLTLNNAYIKTSEYRGIYNQGIDGLTINSVGDNYVEGSSTGLAAYADTVITGSGKLSIYGVNYGIAPDKNVNITFKDADDVTVSAYSMGAIRNGHNTAKQNNTLLFDNSNVHLIHKNDKPAVAVIDNILFNNSYIESPENYYISAGIYAVGGSGDVVIKRGTKEEYKAKDLGAIEIDLNNGEITYDKVTGESLYDSLYAIHFLYSDFFKNGNVYIKRDRTVYATYTQNTDGTYTFKLTEGAEFDAVGYTLNATQVSVIRSMLMGNHTTAELDSQGYGYYSKVTFKAVGADDTFEPTDLGELTIDLTSGSFDITKLNEEQSTSLESLLMGAVSTGAIYSDQKSELLYFDLNGQGEAYDLWLDNSTDTIKVLDSADFGGEYKYTVPAEFSEALKESFTKKKMNYYSTLVFVLPAASGTTRTPGDVNGDGNVNMSDLTRLQQYLAAWGVTINESNADVDGKAGISMGDLTRLQQKLAAWDVELL